MPDRMKGDLAPDYTQYNESNMRGTMTRTLTMIPIGCRKWMLGFHGCQTFQAERKSLEAHVCRTLAICNTFARE